MRRLEAELGYELFERTRNSAHLNEAGRIAVEHARVQWLLNNRPRKVLDWKMPAEVMQQVLMEGATIV